MTGQLHTPPLCNPPVHHAGWVSAPENELDLGKEAQAPQVGFLSSAIRYATAETQAPRGPPGRHLITLTGSMCVSVCAVYVHVCIYTW